MHCFAIHTHSVLIILITLGPKSTWLQSLKLYSHLSNACIVLETSSMDQTWTKTINRIMPTTQGSGIYIDFLWFFQPLSLSNRASWEFKANPPNPRKYIRQGLIWEKIPPPYPPFKFNTHGSPEKMRGLNKLSTEFSWISNGAKPFGHPVLHRFEPPYLQRKKCQALVFLRPTIQLGASYSNSRCGPRARPKPTFLLHFITWIWFFLAYRIYV